MEESTMCTLRSSDYVILNENTHHELQKKVNEYLKKGYKPCGGMFVQKIDARGAYEFREFYQAVEWRSWSSAYEKRN
jgi:Domain of unknown function (DUF1737)